jgi:xanthine dehydrogenase large subunit
MAIAFEDQTDPYHLSGIGLVTGKAVFVGDDIKPSNLLYAKLVSSPYAHAKILNIDVSSAATFPGVIAILTYKDIPGENQIGHSIKDQPLLAENEVMHIGQPIVIIVAKSEKIAKSVVKLVKIDYEKLPTILTIQEAEQAQSWYVPPRKIERGEVTTGFAQADFILEGEVNTNTQEHLYFETQRCLAIPGDDNNFTLYASTQGTTDVQDVAARVLGLSSKDITVDVKRLGGGFGGKECAPVLWSCLAALAAYSTKQPVELKLDRHEDMTMTGKRHPFRGKYKVGFTKAGKILAYELYLSSNGGAFVDISIPILDRAMFHADNAYFLPNVKIVGIAYRTNLPPNTAFRGFGAPQGIFIIESVMEAIALKLKRNSLEIRSVNFYKDGELTPYRQPVFETCHPNFVVKLQEKTTYHKLLAETATFNAQHEFVKRGIGVVPVKFGISFTFTTLNQATALVWIYTDGSISMSHGGIEMGQELNTKVAQVVSRELGVSLSRIRMESSNTQRNGNASPTAASSGSDLNGNAALDAARQIKVRLSKVALELLKAKIEKSDQQITYSIDNDISSNVASPKVAYLVFADDHVYDSRYPYIKITFAEVIKSAYFQRINLGAQGFYKTPEIFFDGHMMQGSPFYYFLFGIALVQIEVDILTGAKKILRVNIVHDAATPLNKSVDLGQITGAFAQGMGYCTMEEMNFDSEGKYLATSLSTYKIPSIREIPELFAIEMVQRECKHASVMGSKAVGEPPLIYGLATYFAIRDALQSLNPEKPVELTMPATPEAVVMAVKAIMNYAKS